MGLVDTAAVAAAEFGRGALKDLAGLSRPLSHGDDLDQWDPDHIRRTQPVLKALNDAYFRPEVRGLENIPAEGPVLLVGNHSGGLVIADTFVLSHAFYDHFGPYRRFHQLAHNLAAGNPLLGILRRYGTVKASHENAQRAFDRDAALLVYPGGDYETFRPSWHGAKIEFGGRQGFIRLALDAGVPIVPVVSMGGQETALFVTRGERISRALRIDRLTRIKVFPISLGPPFGVNLLDLPIRFPLPAKIQIEVLPPVDLEEQFGPDPDHDEVYESVTGRMQDALTGLAEERTLPVLG